MIVQSLPAALLPSSPRQATIELHCNMTFNVKEKSPPTPWIPVAPVQDFGASKPAVDLVTL